MDSDIRGSTKENTRRNKKDKGPRSDRTEGHSVEGQKILDEVSDQQADGEHIAYLEGEVERLKNVIKAMRYTDSKTGP